MKDLKFRAWIKAQEKMIEVASIDFKEKTIIYEGVNNKFIDSDLKAEYKKELRESFFDYLTYKFNL